MEKCQYRRCILRSYFQEDDFRHLTNVTSSVAINRLMKIIIVLVSQARLQSNLECVYYRQYHLFNEATLPIVNYMMLLTLLLSFNYTSLARAA